MKVFTSLKLLSAKALVVLRSFTKLETVLFTNNKITDAILVYRTGDQFVIKSSKVIDVVEVYNLSAKMITALKTNVKEVSYVTKRVYLLRIRAVDREITNKKILKQYAFLTFCFRCKPIHHIEYSAGISFQENIGYFV